MQAADLDLCARLERRTEHRCAVCTSRCARHAHARQVRSRVRVLGKSLGRRYMEAAHRTGLKGLARPGDTLLQELRLPALDTCELPAHAGDAVMQVDADLQDPPEMLESFFELWRQGYHVVYGIRKKRPEGTL